MSQLDASKETLIELSMQTKCIRRRRQSISLGLGSCAKVDKYCTFIFMRVEIRAVGHHTESISECNNGMCIITRSIPQSSLAFL